MKNLAFYLFTLISSATFAQENITLQKCYELVAKHYPLANQSDLLASQNKLDAQVISNSKLPQFNLEAQATYQSDVIEVPIPNANIIPPNKDQYKATLTVNQLIYQGGMVNATLKMKDAQLKTKQKQVEVSLYQIKQYINQLYFSILLAQESESLLYAKQDQLNAQLKEVKSGIENGVILPSSDKILEAEKLKINQKIKDLESNKSSLISSLSQLINQTLNNETVFQKPIINIQLNSELTRPELELFNLKKDEISNNEIVLAKQKSPKLLGFALGGYGNPGLNMLDNSFQPYYIVGLKMQWNIFDWNSNSKQRKSLNINKNIIENEKDVFKLNTNIALQNQQKTIENIESNIQSDAEIIKLRKDVLKMADSQLKNGVITSSAYITELTNLYEDQNTLIRHEIELQLAKANYNIIKGN